MPIGAIIKRIPHIKKAHVGPALATNGPARMCTLPVTKGSIHGVPPASGHLLLFTLPNVRMAVYGMLDQLLALPDIWYCLSCRRCLQGCPNRVKPYDQPRSHR